MSKFSEILDQAYSLLVAVSISVAAGVGAVELLQDLPNLIRFQRVVEIAGGAFTALMVYDAIWARQS